MKRAIPAIILSTIIMTGCYEDYYYDESETTAVSQTTTTAESAEEEISITEGLSDESTYIEDSSDMMPPEDAPEWKEDAPEQSEDTETAEEFPSETEDSTEPTGSETTMTETTTVADTTETAETEQITETAKETESIETTTEPVITTEPESAPSQSDYEKALTVYEYIRENGYGTCVNYACQTYEKCQEIGLPCYLVWTEAGIYGHMANTVCVNGVWFIMDTQAGFFLDFNYGFTEVIDRDESHIGDADMLSNHSYAELFG